MNAASCPFLTFKNQQEPPHTERLLLTATSLLFCSNKRLATHYTCVECMWQHKGAGRFITFLRPFSFRKQTLSKQKLLAAKELETE